MKYEKVKFDVGDEQFDVIHCLGDGQCKCKSCERKGKYTISWTSWFYKLSEDDEAMCGECLKERLIQRRIDEAIKNVLTDIGNINDDNERFKYKDYQWFIDICKKYNVDHKKLFSITRVRKYDCTDCVWSDKTMFSSCARINTCEHCTNRSKSGLCHCLEESSPEETVCPYYKNIEEANE